MSLALRPTSLPSGILIHPAIWPQQICVENWGGLRPLLGEGSSAGSQSNTMWPGPRPIGMPSFILMHPVIWPQYTNFTDRQTGQTDRQRSDSIGRTVLQTVAQKRFALCYRTVVLSCQSVCNVGVLLPSGCMDQNETWHGGIDSAQATLC